MRSMISQGQVTPLTLQLFLLSSDQVFSVQREEKPRFWSLWISFPNDGISDDIHNNASKKSYGNHTKWLTLILSSISGEARPVRRVPKFLFTEATHFSILSICKRRGIIKICNRILRTIFCLNLITKFALWGLYETKSIANTNLFKVVEIEMCTLSCKTFSIDTKIDKQRAASIIFIAKQCLYRSKLNIWNLNDMQIVQSSATW